MLSYRLRVHRPRSQLLSAKELGGSVVFMAGLSEPQGFSLVGLGELEGPWAGPKILQGSFFNQIDRQLCFLYWDIMFNFVGKKRVWIH